MDASIIRLGLEVFEDINDEDEFYISLEDMVLGVFFQASKTVRDYLILHNIKHLYILHRLSLWDCDQLIHVAIQAGKISRSVGLWKSRFPVVAIHIDTSLSSLASKSLKIRCN